jgi:hypothetical protein
MIVISAGMYKAGSGWYFNLTNDLLMAANKSDIRIVCEKFHLDNMLNGENYNIGALTFRKLLALSIPHFLGYTFVVKTHRRPSRELRWLMSLGLAKATYIYRDPRDVIISLFEHGQRIKSEKPNHIFAQQDSIETAIEFIRKPLQVYDEWINNNSHVLHESYENLVLDPETALIKLADFLSLSVERSKIKELVKRYTPENLDNTKENLLHYNKGKLGRFKDIMTRAQQDLCNEQFGDYLRKMGYPLT